VVYLNEITDFCWVSERGELKETRKFIHIFSAIFGFFLPPSSQPRSVAAFAIFSSPSILGKFAVSRHLGNRSPGQLPRLTSPLKKTFKKFPPESKNTPKTFTYRL
jgi:hypothetical protein